MQRGWTHFNFRNLHGVLTVGQLHNGAQEIRGQFVWHVRYDINGNGGIDRYGHHGRHVVEMRGMGR